VLIHQERRQYANSSSWSTIKQSPWNLTDTCHPVTVKGDDSDSSSSEGTRTKKRHRRKAPAKSAKKKKALEEGQEPASESEEQSEDSGEDTDMNEFKVKQVNLLSQLKKNLQFKTDYQMVEYSTKAGEEAHGPRMEVLVMR